MTQTLIYPNPTTAPQPETIPRLQHGDHLSRQEFERRYTAMPNVRAELLNGVVFMASPLHHYGHGKPHFQIITWLGVYCAATPGVDYSDNATVRLDGNNEVQPDALLRRDPADGGKSWVSHDDYIEGPPELVIEIATSSSDYDYTQKRLIYQQVGVQEYLLWRVQMQTIDWWELHHGSYRQRAANAEGIITSGVFPGLRLHTRALLAGDFAAVLATQQTTSVLPGDPLV